MGLNNFDEKSCGILLFREKDGKKYYLLLHYPSGHWDFPKGHVEEGEKERETAARELLEETGIADPEFLQNFREQISYKYYKEGKLSNKQVIFFLAKTQAKEIKLSHEHHNFVWLPYEQAYQKLTFENAKNLLKKARQCLGTSEKRWDARKRGAYDGAVRDRTARRKRRS